MTLRLDYKNIHNLMLPCVHGTHEKDLFVLHETDSPDEAGWSDLMSNAYYLAHTLRYGIHGLNDEEGHQAWAYGLGNAIFYQAGGVNERSAGLEQVSPIAGLVQQGHVSIKEAKQMWESRHIQIHSSAMMVACWHNVNPKKRPLKYSDSTAPGVTTHWSVSQHHAASLGHTDCHPVHLGGWYPALEVIYLARTFAGMGYHF